MAFEEFNGELDPPAGGAVAYVPFSGELDAPAKGAAAPSPAPAMRTEPVYDPVSGAQIGANEVPDEAPAKGGALADELGNLRDSFFTGVDNTRASVKTVNMGMVAKRMQATGERLKELEARGEGDSVAARQMRDEIASARGQLPRVVGEMTEAQGDAQRGANLSTRPAVAKVNAAKTFGEAWEAFKEAPYDVIAGVTATSLPSTLPALAAAAVMGPGAGALAMGANSAVVEGGSSLADFARDAGVDVTDAKAVEAFFTNPQNLSAAMTYAGKRAGIIGALDAASGGMAGKTIAPVMKSKIARQAVNLPAQMAVQAGLGAGGEALGQLATKGKIDQPGQVLMEAAGELGGAPMEVAAFSKEARDAMRPTMPAPAVAPRVDPIAEIAKAQNVDQAIAAAQTAVQSNSAVDNIQNILATQNLAASPAAQAQAAVAGIEAGMESANAPAAPTPETAAPADAAAAPISAGDQLAAGGDTEVAAAVPAEPVAAPVDQRLVPVSKRAVSSTPVPTPETPARAENSGGAAINTAASTAEMPTSSSTENVQNPAPRAQPETQAAPAKAPEARASAGVEAAATGTQAGNTGLEAARVDQRLVPLSKRVKLDAEQTPAQTVPAAVDPASAAKVEAVTGKPLDKQWTAFAPDSGTLAVPRADMPQIKAEYRGAMVNFLNARGIAHQQEEVPASSLKPTQAEFSPGKVEQAKGYTDTDRSILVSSDGHVLDGHHQWMAKLQAGEPVKVIRLDAPIKQLLEAVKEFPSAELARGATAAASPARAAPTPGAQEPAPAARAPQGKQVSFYPGKYGKGMGKEAAKLEAQRLNRVNAGKGVTYTAEEHDDPKLENPWAVVGRKPDTSKKPTAPAVPVEKTAPAPAAPAAPAEKPAPDDAPQFSRAAPEPASAAQQATEILDAAGVTGKERLDALIAVKAGNLTPEELEAAYPSKEETTAEESPAADETALKTLSKLDDLFALPKSEATTVEAITAENDPDIKVKRGQDMAGSTEYTFTMKDGSTATMTVRKPNPYGPSVYAMELQDGEGAFDTSRPGENPEDVPEGTEDVYINVADLKTGTNGNKIYNIAATFAHNTGRIFIGDPAGLSDAAMRRRLENMISSALKFGTTEHLAPHPRQVEGDPAIGMPALEWVYGDDEGNVERMIDASIKATENVFPTAKNLSYDLADRTFRNAINGRAVPFAGLGRLDTNLRTVREGPQSGASKGQVGWRTLARNALYRAVSEATATAPQSDGRSLLDRLSEHGAGLGTDPGTGRAFPEKDRIFYSEREQAKPAAVRNPSTVDRVQAAVAELIGGKQLPNRLGRVVSTTASEIKSYWEPQIGMNVQLSADEKAGAAQAFYDPRTKTVFLIADHIPAGDEQAVAAHELMHKHGQTVLGAEGWEKLHTTINGWANAEEGSDERAVYTYARRQVEAVGTELSSQEMFPYAVEAAIKMGVKPSLIAKKGTVARWLGSVKYAMQQAWGKVTGKPETFKTQDLVDLAFGIAQMENPESAAAMGRITDALVNPDTAEVDDGLVVTPGKGLIKGKFLSSADGNGTPGGPWNTEAEALDAAKAWRAKLEQKAADALMDRARKDDFAQRLRAGHMPTPQEVEGLGLRAAGSELKYFVPRAVELFGITSRQVRPLIADLIRTGTTDMGAQRESVNPMKALAQMAKAQTDDIRFSRAPAPGTKLSPWKDATGRMQFAPGAWLYENFGPEIGGATAGAATGAVAGPVGSVVGAVIGAVSARKMIDKLSLKAASPELRRQLRQMKIDVEKAQETAVAIAKETTKLSEAERAMVSDLVEQELKVGVIPPAHAVKLAAMINDAMGRQTDELVALDMLTKDSADKWRGQYLPRYYEPRLRNALAKTGSTWGEALRALTGRQSVMKGIKGKNLKGRGLYETIPEDQLKDYEALGWEPRDPDYKPGQPSPDGTVQVWRDFSPAEREKMGEIRDAGFRFVTGYMQSQKDIALGKMFARMADDPEQSSRLEKDGYVQVPTTTVSGTGVKVYGKLAGRWVPMETLSQLSNIEENTNSAWKMYRQAMAVWKMGKTSMNPVSHVNNMVSNLTMAHLAGVSYHRGDKYLAAARDFIKNPAMMVEAKENGLFLGTLSDAELMNGMPEELKILAQRQESSVLKIARTGFDIMTLFLRKPMGAAYQFEDTFFRYLIYKDARENGLEPQDAVDYAQKYIFTYDDLPKGARRIRDFGIPFFSYTYKAAPALLHTALTHPVRMAAPAAVLWGINAAAYAIATGDDDDSWQDALKKYLTDPEFRAKTREKEKLEREHLPPWNKGTTALLTPKTLRLGMDEVTKLPLFIDISRIIPGGDLFDVSPNAGGLPIPQPVTPSHPLFTTMVAMLGNKDLFLGKEIVDNNDTRGEATAKRSAWLWTQLTPAITAGNYHWQRGMNALAQANGGEVKWVPDILGGDATGIGKDGNPVQPKFAAMQTFGIKVRPVDLDTAEAIEGSMKRKMIRDIDGEIKKLQRLNSRGAISDRAMEAERDKARAKKDRLNEGLTVDGDAKD